MVRAYLHKEGRDALDQIKILFLETESPLNIKALGDQLQIFSGENTKEINDDERTLLFDIVDRYLYDQTIVYHCMYSLSCNIKEGLVFMNNSVTTSRMCITTNSVCKVYSKNTLIVNLMACILANLTKHKEAVGILVDYGFQDNFLEMMKTAMASEVDHTAKYKLGLLWCGRIFNNIFVSGLFDDDFFESFGMNALILLIEGMSSTSDYYTFEDSVDTIINIYEEMKTGSKSQKVFYQYLYGCINFETFLCTQIKKFQDQKKRFKQLIVPRLVNCKLVSCEKFTEKCL